MNKPTALVAVMVFVAALGSTGAVTAASGTSLATDFDSTATDNTTVVVAIGNTSTESGRASLVAANAIANNRNWSVVRVDGRQVSVPIAQTLTQQVRHGRLRSVVVVGVGESKVESVTDDLLNLSATVGGDEITLDVRDQITGDTPGNVLYRAAIQQWNSASAAFLTTTGTGTPAKVGVALANESLAGSPVLGASTDYTDLNATLDYLNVSTVYVTPGVSDDTRDRLRNDGYTVDPSPAGVNLNQAIQSVAIGYAPDTAEDVAVVGGSTHIHAASQVGVGTNATLLVTKSSGQLGSAAKNQLQNLTEVENVYVLGNTEDVSSSVFSSITDATRDNASVDRVTRRHEVSELYLRTNLLVSGYQFGVLTSHVTSSSGDQITVEITNIGYSNVPVVDGVSVKAAWSGNGPISSNPDGHLTASGTWVVTNSDPMDPEDTWEVELEADSFENGGHPHLDYYVETSSGALLGSGDTLLHLLVSTFDPGPVSTPVLVAGAAVAFIAVAYGMVDWAFGGPARRRVSGTLGNLTAKELLLRLVLIIGAVILAIPSDPITDTAGWLLGAVVLAEIALNQR